jgi:hypothetical protein
LIKYLKKIQTHLSRKDGGKEVLLNQIPREKNIRENLLFKLVNSNLDNLLLEVWIEILEKLSIKKGSIIVFVDIRMIGELL